MIMNMAVMNFIPRCRRMLGDGTILNRVIAFSTIYGLFEGISIFALLPAITSLVTGQPVLGLGVTGWIVVLACLAVLGGVANYFQLSRGYSVAMFFIRVAHDMIGNRVATLPLGWFNKPLAGKLSRMVSTEQQPGGQPRRARPHLHVGRAPRYDADRGYPLLPAVCGVVDEAQ